MKTLFCTRYRVQILLKNQHFSVSAHCGMGTCKPKAFCTPGVSLGSEGFLGASTSKRVLESHRPEEVPEIARHLRCPEVIFSYISSPLLLSERLRPNSREEQEQRKPFQAVPRYPCTPLRHKGCRWGYFGDVQPLSAARSDCRAAFTHCRTDRQGSKSTKLMTSVLHLPEPPSVAFCSQRWFVVVWILLFLLF